MQYTENYQFREPTPAVDVVKVGDINYNSRKIDELIHSTQISLAPAYDETRTSSNPYMTGDVVMKDALMYKCLDDDVYGAWDATKWERTTAGEEGAGDSSVEANPQGTPTDDLDTIGINGTIYNIAGSGGGNVYGAFVDTNKIITTLTGSGSGDDFEDYTAVEDCAVIGTIRGNSGAVQIDGVTVAYTSDASETIGVCVYAKRGQTVSYRMNSSSTLTIYGLTFGTQNIFTPQIYSTEERCVGVWTDGKPLYQKSIPFDNTSSSQIQIDISSMNIDNLIQTFLWCKDIRYQVNTYYDTNADYINSYYDGQDKLLKIRRSSSYFAGAGYATLLYTKTTDTAGSGSYNTLGVPMVHYSTDEQVVGTDEDGNTIYEKTFKIASPTWSSGSGYATIAVDVSSIGTVDKINFVRGNVYDNTDDRMFDIPYFRVENSESLLYECRVNSDGTPYFVIFVRSSSGAGYSLSNLSVTLQYTKSSS